MSSVSVWHAQSVEAIAKNLVSTIGTGLHEAQVLQAWQKYGYNILQREQTLSWWKLLLLQFRNPLVFILMVAVALTAWLQEWTDMTVILVVIMLNSSIGFWQEYRSSHILEKLQQLVRVKALVKRDGVIKEIDAEQLVPGDIIIVKPGMKVPADARVIHSVNLATNEAALTGESTPVRKSEIPLPVQTDLAERVNMVFMGTTIERGEASAIVVAIGNRTELGKITLLTQQTKDVFTPLQERLRRLSRIISIFIIICAVIIVVAGWLEGENVVMIFTLAVAVAVAAIPEGLPAAVSVILAVAGQRIYKTKGLIKRLGAVETLGAVTVICTDKTGTLTEGRMKVAKVINYSTVTTVLEIAALANEALVEVTDTNPKITGDTTDMAKLEAFFKAGGNLQQLLQAKPRIATLPFDAEKKYLASFHKISPNKVGVFVAGAPEAMLQLATSVANESTSVAQLRTQYQRQQLQAQYEDSAQHGYRMIALGYREVAGSIQVNTTTTEWTNQVKDLILCGFLALQDPVRREVKTAVATCQQAGIRVVMITGDHKLTAQAVGRDLGLTIASDTVLEGKELDQLSDIELEQRVQTIQIYARSNPEHKMRIVKAWQKHQAVVAMTGDGINDAPAIKAADVGIALNAGTDVTKEAAELVLLNDSFATILEAIRQGRIAFNNIRKVTVFLLIGSFTELIIVMSSLIFHLPLPITAVQILWANLIEDGLPTFSLAFEPGGKNVLRRPPLLRQEPIVNKEGYAMIFTVGLLTDIVLAGMFFWLYRDGNLAIEYIRTMIFTTLSLDALISVFALKSFYLPIYQINLRNNRYLLLASVVGVTCIILAIYLPLFNNYLETVPLLPQHLGLVLALAVLDLFLIECIKWFVRRPKGNLINTFFT
jgi:Ca2+-transporting ATPase